MLSNSTLDLKALQVNRNIVARNYWRQRLEGLEPMAYFGYERYRQEQTMESPQYEEYSSVSAESLYRLLTSVAGSEKSQHMLLLSALLLFAAKYASCEDVCVFTPKYPGRHEGGTGNELIPVRRKAFGGMSFADFVLSLKQDLIGDLQHVDYPIDKLLGAGGINVNGFPVTGMLLEGMQDISAFDGLSPDIVFSFVASDRLRVSIRYDSRKYEADYIRLLPGLYFSLLERVIGNKEVQVGNIGLISESERHDILHVFNDTGHHYEDNRPILTLWEDRVKEDAGRTAVWYRGQSVSYGILNEKANQLACFLLTKGVARQRPVAILLERSDDFVICVLAVLKAGCLYLPVDAGYPDERINYLLRDSGAECLLTKKDLVTSKNIRLPAHTVCLDEDKGELDACSVAEPVRVENSAIYVLYTSGSTGKPKGVIGTHAGLINRLRWGWENYPYRGDDICCQKTSVGFGDHVVELFSPLLKGILLVIFGQDEIVDLARMTTLLIERKITRITLVPSLLQALVRIIRDRRLYLGSMRYVFCSGERLAFQLAREFYATFGETCLVNIYGSTEVSADVTSYNVPNVQLHTGNKRGVIPIGKPISLTKIVIVDKANRLVPVGVPGEILISGEGVTPGYLNGPELSGSKLIENPFFPELMAFRSGDLGRWLPDGTIEYLGRLDHQVKIRGFRIRLDEIESELAQHGQIKDLVVTVHGEGEDKYLAAYYVSDREIRAAALKSFLSDKLPDYMVPAFFIRLGHMPVTPSGKMDRLSLPVPERERQEDLRGPATEMERELVRIWSEVLKLKKESISMTASFFELGGHSLRAMTLVNKIQGELGIDLSIKDVFEHKDIQSLCQLLRSAKRTEYAKLKKAEKREYYNLSIAQRRVHYFYELDNRTLTFNLPAVARLTGELDKKRLEEAFRQLIVRHETLRTAFKIVNDAPVQLVLEQFAFEIAYHQSTEEEMILIIEEFIRPFDLERAPLFRVGLIGTGPGEHILMVDMHHIVSDGTSFGLLIKDFMALYNGVELLPMQWSYKDYAVWQQSVSYQRKIAGQKDFWIREFSEEVTPLDIPLDFSRTATTEGDSVEFELSKEETSQLRAIAEGEVATISMVILSVLSILLNKLSGQEDIVIGMVVAGREQFELEDMIGMFPLVLPLRTNPEAKLGFREFLTSLKAKFLATFDNQSYQYEELARELNLKRTTGRNPWFDVMYLYQNFERSELTIPDLTLAPYHEQNIIAYEKLNLTVNENEDQLFLKLVYSTGLFRRETIERFVRYFLQIVKTVIDDEDVRLSRIEITSAEERSLLLSTFDTKKETDRGKTFGELFGEQAAKTPGRMAVEHHGQKLTYAELYGRSKRWSAHLAGSEGKENRNIALFLPRGVDMLTGMIAIFHSGGTYVPIDIDYPRERVKEILMDSEPEIVLTTKGLSLMIEELKVMVPAIGKIICVDLPEEPAMEAEYIQKRTGEELAYIIYTSGTTGKPKGVMIDQLGMINHLYAMVEVLELSEDDVIAQTASPCFDISIWQFLVALLTGGCTCIIDKEKMHDPYLLMETLQAGKVSVLQTVPSHLTAFLNDLPREDDIEMPQLRWMIPTGEPLSVSLVEKWYSRFPDMRLLNAYGPAEASDDVTTYVVEPPEEGQVLVPVGKAVRNMHVYILDEALQLCPPGVKGEICVAGIGVGKGYWNDPDKTRKAYIPNPFVKELNDPDYGRLYRTGDLGYYREDGNFVCMGRKDDQVKLRGFRIEPGEIESRLLSRDSIKEAVVLVKEWGGSRYLIAYYVSENEIPAPELEGYLSDKLPHYMIPSYFIHLKQLPLTLNGKLDKRALPEPEIKSTAVYEAPAGEIEIKLHKIWVEVLNLGNMSIGIHDNFFEVGGHSLTAIRLVSAIRREMDIMIPITLLFQYSTIRSMAKRIEYGQ